jgi:hypothetical protein
MYAGCVSGAIQKNVYLELIKTNGFENITIRKEKPIHIPDDILKNHLDEDQIHSFRNGSIGIFSIPVFANKPLSEKDPSCSPGAGCF